MNTVIIKKQGSKLKFEISDGTVCYYDFATSKFIKLVGDKEVYLSGSPRVLVRIPWYTDYDGRNKYVSFEDEKYGRYCEYVSRHHGCTTIGTLVGKLKEHPDAEQFFAAGFTAPRYGKSRLPKPSYINRRFGRFLLENNLAYYNWYNGVDQELLVEYFEIVKEIYFDGEVNGSFRNFVTYENNCAFGIYQMLITTYRYNKRTLVTYLRRLKDSEALSNYPNTITTLRDYARMMDVLLNGSFEKYPKNLLTAHHITVANFNSSKQTVDGLLFKRAVEHYIDLEDEIGEFAFLAPKEPQDLIREGANLHHCVASYVNSVSEMKTKIMLLRNKKSLDESLVTIEVRNGAIVQAKGLGNRCVTQIEHDVIILWAERKKLEYY